MPETRDERRETREAEPSAARPPVSRLPSPVPSSRQLLVVDLGTQPYAETLELQREVARRRIAGEIDQDILLLVEHPHVVTLGRSSKQGNLIASPEYLAARGVELFEVERGGDVTYHGPGQLVGYPIIDLKRHRQDLHWYLRQIEEALIITLRELGIEATRRTGYTGVWVTGETGDGRSETGADEGRASALASPAARRPSPVASRKIASIGVHARDWVTWHGFALNVSTDLHFFDSIVPCGIAGVQMTSLREEMGGTSMTGLRYVGQRVAAAMGGLFDLTPLETDLPLSTHVTEA
ncbi:MAG: lipoyl(octanoyl) transferase LipB [Gemmatimonadaceae bacterium]